MLADPGKDLSGVAREQRARSGGEMRVVALVTVLDHLIYFLGLASTSGNNYVEIQ